jgi:hypothetical protein
MAHQYYAFNNVASEEEAVHFCRRIDGHFADTLSREADIVLGKLKDFAFFD